MRCLHISSTNNVSYPFFISVKNVQGLIDQHVKFMVVGSKYLADDKIFANF